MVQVRKGKYPNIDIARALELGDEATAKDKRGMLRFNPGKERSVWPKYNPYTIRRCRDCDIANGKGTLARLMPPDNIQCVGCKLLHEVEKANAKLIRKLAKPLQGTELTHPEIEKTVLISGKSIKGWTNQPHSQLRLKNKMLLEIAEVFTTSKYLGRAGNHKKKPRITDTLVFEVMVGGEPNYILVLEYDWGELILHSITDEVDEISKHIKKHR